MAGPGDKPRQAGLEPARPDGCNDACGLIGQWALMCVHPEHRHLAAMALDLPEWAERLGAPEGQR